MKNSSLYRTLTTNQLKMAIFLIGFLLIAAPGIAEAKLITLGTDIDTVSMGNLLGIGTTAPSQSLSINIPAGTTKGITFKEADGTTYGAGIYYSEAADQLRINTIQTSTDVTGITMTRANANVGIGLTNPTIKLDVSGAFRNSLATTHTLLGGSGNVIIMADNAGSLFSATPDVFVGAINVSTLYHIKKWFTPQAGQTISSSGTTVTMANPVSNYQFSSSMVGSRLTINGEARVITAYTSTSVVTVDSAFSTNYSGFDYTLWGVYSRAVDIASDGSISTYSETGSMAIKKRSGDANTYIPALLDSTSNYYLPSSVLYLDKDFPIKWSGSTSYSSSANDVGLRRAATNTLEIFNGTSTVPGTVADYRDLNLRSLNPAGGNIGIGTTTASNNKLTVVTDQSGGGVIKVQNTNIASWSSYEMFDYAGVHKASFGYANPSAPTVAGLAHFSTSDDTPFIIAIHDLEKIRITTDGFVGIGTTTPSGLLVLDRNQDAATDMFIVNTSASSSAKTQLLTWNGASYSAFGARGTGFSSWGAMDASDAYMWSDDDISLLTSAAGKSIKFGTGDGTPTERMRITDAGNVGIGLTNPGFKVHIKGGASAVETTMLALQSLQTTSNTATTLRFGNSSSDVAPQGTAEITALRTNTGTSGATDFIFRNSNGGTVVENMRILSTGNVGIGTTAPAYKLEVVGTSRFSGGNTSFTGGLTLASTFSTNGGELRIGSTGIVSAGTNVKINWSSSYDSNATKDVGLTRYATGTLQIFDGITLGEYRDLNLRNMYASENVSALSFTDRTPYPKNLTQAYNAVMSMQRLPDGEYNENNKEQQLNHALLDPYIKAGDSSRDLSASVSSQNEVLKYILERLGGINSSLSIDKTGNVGIGITNPTAKLDVAGTVKLGTAGTAFTAMGTCTIASTAISTTPTNYTCTSVPASTAVAVTCSGAAAQSGSGTLYCRATGTANQVACNTSAANTTAMTWACMWTQL